MIIRLWILYIYIYPENPATLQNKNRRSWSGEDWGGLRRPEDAGTLSGVSQGLVTGGLRRRYVYDRIVVETDQKTGLVGS